MIFALLFFLSFLIGLIAYAMTDRWWIGVLLSGAIPLFAVLFGAIASTLQSMALYFGLPVAFFGSLFGAYIVDLRRAPELVESQEESESADGQAKK